MRVIIAGSRGFADYAFLRQKMDYLLSETPGGITIVSGGARGADSMGERYAGERGYEVARYPAEWEKYGKSAGYRRNAVMAANADALVAFWDGKSPGTRHMINLAMEKGLKIRLVLFGGDAQCV